MIFKEKSLEDIVNELYDLVKQGKHIPCGEWSHCLGRLEWRPFYPFCNYIEIAGLNFLSLKYPSQLYKHCKTKKFIRKLLTGYNVRTLEQALILYEKAEYVPISNAEVFILNAI